MIRKLVDFALNNRFLVIAAALLLFVWGAIAFHQLPVEAYPDVANNYVEIITQWPEFPPSKSSSRCPSLSKS
jgi:cobalt-zinc-cadmium resistance protein CzcA